QAGRALLDATLVRMAMSEQFASIGQLLSRLDASGEGARPVATRPPGSGVAPKLPVQSPAQKKKPDEVSALSTASSVGATLVSPLPPKKTMTTCPRSERCGRGRRRRSARS